MFQFRVSYILDSLKLSGLGQEIPVAPNVRGFCAACIGRIFATILQSRHPASMNEDFSKTERTDTTTPWPHSSRVASSSRSES